MKLTKLLLWMHADFRDRLNALERVVRAGGIGEDVELAHELSLFIRILQIHEWAEEEVLYPALAKLPPIRKPVSSGHAGHEAVHQKILEIDEALDHPEATLTLLLATEGFITLMRQHMLEEERGILAEAEKRLPPEELEKLGDSALQAMKQRDLPPGALPGALDA